MDQQTFRQAILLLSGEHSVSILRALRDGNWHLSSEVATSAAAGSSASAIPPTAAPLPCGRSATATPS